MNTPRRISRMTKSEPVLEGAGVHLHRAFGHGQVPRFDPFLLLDDFRSTTQDHYLQGFPWHPHRGIETITYILTGEVEHGDSMGNNGDIGPGDVQWMTAGSGIIHQEMPRGDAEGRLEGFQLWANLPAGRKMMEPRYRDVMASQIPTVVMDNGTEIKIICGRVGDTEGPVKDIVIDPEYLDVTVQAETKYTHPTRPGYTVFLYVIDGLGYFGPELETGTNRTLVLFEDGDHLMVSAGDEAVRFLLISGKPIQEPVAWQGPIVMNTQQELMLAFEEFRKGTFVRAQQD